MTGSLFPLVPFWFHLETGVSTFSLCAGMVGSCQVLDSRVSLCAEGYFDFMLYSYHRWLWPLHHFRLFLRLFGCLLVCCFFAWMRTAILAGGNCGRPLRLFGYVENGDMVTFFVLRRLGYRPNSAWSKKENTMLHLFFSIIEHQPPAF